MSGRPKAQLVLSKTEREQLEALTLRRKTGQALALRARIVLSCADGADNKVVAARQRVTHRRCRSGGPALWSIDSTVCWMRRGLERRARSMTRASMR